MKSSRFLMSVGFIATVVALSFALYITTPYDGRISTQESAAGSAMKHGILSCESMAVAERHLDSDHDGVGEFTTLVGLIERAQLASAYRAQTDGQATGQVIVNGYRYALFLPDGRGGAIDATDLDPRSLDLSSADARERWFVAYAWPVDQGRRMFAVTQAGEVWATRPQAARFEAPVWNTLCADKSWGGTPDPRIWLPYRR